MASTRLAAESQYTNSRLLTPALFDRILAQNAHDPATAVFKFDDFTGYNTLTSSGAFGAGHWYGFIENSATVANLTTDTCGVIQLASGTTADNDISIGDGQVAGMLNVADGTAVGTITGKGTYMAWECRVRFPDITDGDGSVFCGIIEPGKIANDGNISDAHAIGAMDLIGFWVLDSDNSTINYGYNVGSGTAVSSGTADVIDATTDWFKLGFVYNPDAPENAMLQFYIDGDAVGTPVSWTTIQASTFPGFQPMGTMMQAKTDASATMRLDIDWIAYGQLR